MMLRLQSRGLLPRRAARPERRQILRWKWAVLLQQLLLPRSASLATATERACVKAVHHSPEASSRVPHWRYEIRIALRIVCDYYYAWDPPRSTSGDFVCQKLILSVTKETTRFLTQMRAVFVVHGCRAAVGLL